MIYITYTYTYPPNHPHTNTDTPSYIPSPLTKFKNKGTKQACLFRDAYASLTASGLAIYGLSTDSPRANTTFKDKQKLPYPLLCDPSATLIAAIGLKKSPKGTTRGVFVVDKAGKVLAAEAGGPDGTLAVAKKVVAELVSGDAAAVDAEVEEAEAKDGEETVPVVEEGKVGEKAEEGAAAEGEKKEEEGKGKVAEEKGEEINGEAGKDGEEKEAEKKDE
ncbi:thioredoxin-like protein [Cercophora scortea]|uniref:Thioredoxin-like protein n=1 Tax=Cercophora scortea TaxID=314031 RepID=A0AAE0MCH2_9PEZI|nr:thioredoxin-like protein [Cercophora scortea]